MNTAEAPGSSIGASASGDLSRLTEFLRAVIYPDARGLEITELRRPLGGASWETFLVALCLVDGDGRRRSERVVVRRAPVDGPMAPYDVTKDATIFRVLRETDVPVPNLLAWTEDSGVFERPFLVTEFVEGESSDLSQIERWPLWQRDREGLGFEMIDRLAALQRVQWRGTGIEDVLGSAGDARDRLKSAVDRALAGLSGVALRTQTGVPIWRDIAAWLASHVPPMAEDDVVVVHGDYRFGNFIWQEKRIAAVLDWERAMLGSPMQDLGFLCMPLSRRRQPEIMGKVLSFEALTARYEASAGRPVDIGAVQYYAAFWQFLEGINTTRALLQERTPMISSGVLAQPNLIARQTYALIDHLEAGRAVL